MNNNFYPFVNEPLAYEFDALEPYIDTKTMELHYKRHLQTYIDNLNKVLKDNASLQKYSLQQLNANVCCLPEEVQCDIAHNAGGVYNHRLFFEQLSPNAQHEPKGALKEAVKDSFGSFEKFKEEFTKAALGVFGSGYAWLAICPGQKKVRIITTANQDSILLYCMVPLITLDVWEHAYYLKHYNVRKDYIADWFNVVDLKRADAVYDQVIEDFCEEERKEK